MRVLVIGRTIEEGNSKLRELANECRSSVMGYRSSSNGDSFYTENGDTYKVVTIDTRLISFRCEKIYAQYCIDTQILDVVFLPNIVGDLPHEEKFVRW